MSNTEQTQAPEVVDQAVDTHEKKSPQESFGELRKAKEDLERQLWQAQKEREMFERQLQMQAQYQQKPQETSQEEDFDFRQLEQEEFPDGKKLVKAFSQVNKKLSSYEQKLAEKDVKIQLLETLSDPSMADFREIVTAENIEKYIKSDEDYSDAVAKAANPLKKVYNLLKKDHKFQSEKQANLLAQKPISQEQKRVDEKEGKPKTSSLGVRSEAVSVAAQTSNSTMSKQQREALWRETQELAKKSPRR
jgi:hypothetical protein